MNGVAAKAASRAASASGTPPAARPARRRVLTGVPAYRAARPRAPTVSAGELSAPGWPPSGAEAAVAGELTGPFWIRMPLPSLTDSCQRPELAGRVRSLMTSGTDSETPGGKPRAATAPGASTTRSIHMERLAVVASRSLVSHPDGPPGASTTRSIHMERLAIVASRSLVSHQNGSSGAVYRLTVEAVEECEATTDQSARRLSRDAACRCSTNTASSPPPSQR